MSREREIEKLQIELKCYKDYLLQCLLYPNVHKNSELEHAATIFANILYKLRTIYGIKM